MTLRQVLNVTYSALASEKDKDELKTWDAWLHSDPVAEEKRQPESRGVAQLLAVTGGFGSFGAAPA